MTENRFAVEGKVLERHNTRYVGERDAPIRYFSIQMTEQDKPVWFQLKFGAYDRFDDFIRENQYVRLIISFSSREYQGKYFTDTNIVEVQEMNANDFYF